MPEIVLDTFDLDTAYVEAIDEKLVAYFAENIYRPLYELVSRFSSDVSNSDDYLLRAIQEGRVTYYRGAFSGKFNSRLSKQLKKMGAVFKNGKFKLPKGQLPDDVSMALSISVSSWNKTVDQLNQRMNKILDEDSTDKIKLDSLIEQTLFSLNAKFEDSVKGVAIAPSLSDRNVRDISEGYTNNMRLYIRDFTEKEIVKLRSKVKESTLSGVRYEALAKDIKRSYGVSKSKAKFLARQETNLLVAKFKESRYTEIGVDEYIWQTVIGSPSHPVRPMHKALNGTRQKFSSPPVVNEKGERKNPSEDYGCRCKARPVIKF